MDNRYDNSSQKYSRGYATPETQNRYDYTQRTSGFADSLESQFFYDRPANSLQNQQAPSRDEYTVQQGQPAYREAPVTSAPTFADSLYAQQPARQSEGQGYGQGYQAPVQDYPRDEVATEAERAQNLSQRYASRPGERFDAAPGHNAMNYTTDDLTPSVSTMQFASNVDDRVNPFEDFHKKGETALDKKYTINTKGKILIAVYALVVITVFALIILNTRLLKTMNSTVSQKEDQIKELQVEVENLNSELKYLSSDEVINQKAADLGMTKAEGLNN